MQAIKEKVVTDWSSSKMYCAYDRTCPTAPLPLLPVPVITKFFSGEEAEGQQ